MNEILYWYLVGVLASVPMAFYYIGAYFTSSDGRRNGASVRLFAVSLYLITCFGSWVAVLLGVLVFLTDLLVGEKMNRRGGYYE